MAKASTCRRHVLPIVLNSLTLYVAYPQVRFICRVIPLCKWTVAPHFSTTLQRMTEVRTTIQYHDLLQPIATASEGVFASLRHGNCESTDVYLPYDVVRCRL